MSNLTCGTVNFGILVLRVVFFHEMADMMFNDCSAISASTNYNNDAVYQTKCAAIYDATCFVPLNHRMFRDRALVSDCM